MRFTRRHFFRVPAAVAAAAVPNGPLAACQPATSKAGEGPFNKPGAPQRSVLREPGMSGARLMFFGRVLNADCKPIPEATVDLWHSNEKGEYDNQGFRLRGKVRAGHTGAFRFETVQPSGYSTGGNGFRRAHFHVKVHIENQGVFTTELYFPGDARNSKDSAFTESRMVKVQSDGRGKAAAFDFVLA